MGFKPCYKWNTFNTIRNKKFNKVRVLVLNLVISGIPSILFDEDVIVEEKGEVLNLVISGTPSIHNKKAKELRERTGVLNLVISGIPSIPLICIRILILW